MPREIKPSHPKAPLYFFDRAPVTSITEAAVRQHEDALQLSFTQLTDDIADGQVPESAVTQHEAALTIDWDQLVNTPTTRDGYGITDVYTEAEADAEFLSQSEADALYLDGSGTAGALSKWSDSDTLEDSILSESGSSLFIEGVVGALLKSDDAGVIQIGGGSAGSASNGGFMQFTGNGFDATDRGRFQIVAGNPSTPTGNDGTITFYTGATAERWQINRSGHFICPTDNTVDIGTVTGANLRPRNIHLAGGVGFYGTAATTKQTVTGSRGSNAALASLLTALAAYGLITDSSS